MNPQHVSSVKLSEVCEIVSGSTPQTSNAAFWNGNIRWLTPAEITSDQIEIFDTVRHISEAGRQSAGLQIFPAGTVILSSRAPIGKVAIAGVEMTCNQGFKNLICSQRIYNKYLYHFLKSKTEFLNTLGRGATFKEISKRIVSEIRIPLPSIMLQKEIAEQLDKLQLLISLRKKELYKYEMLSKSRFIEMFGDPTLFASAPLETNIIEMFIGPFGSSLKNECFVAKEDGYCMVYEQKHAIQKTMSVETRYVNQKKYKELERFAINGGDIIVSCRGTIGETYIVPIDAPLGIMHPSIMKIRLKESAYNKVFFNYLLQRVLKRHEKKANGSGIKMAITATVLGKETFIVPPLALQNEFAAFVKELDKSKVICRNMLNLLGKMKHKNYNMA